MIDQQFDDILKRKLNDMADASKSDWSIFANKLSEVESSDILNEGGFDNTIKQKLAGMTTVSASSDWNTFKHMLDEDQITDEMLDDKVSQEMNSMRAPYRQDHWELLHDNIEYQNSRNRNIASYKIIELSLMFLILLSANNFFKYLPSTFEVEKPKLYAGIGEQLNEKLNAIDSGALKIDLNGSVESSTSKDVVSESKIIASAFQLNEGAFATNEIIELSKSNSNQNVSFDINSTTFVDGTTSNLINTNVITSINEMDILEPSNLVGGIEEISSINPQLQLNRQINAPVTIQAYYPAEKSKHSIAVFAGIDNNLVNSPFDNVYDEKRFRTYGFGYSAGVDYGYESGNREWSVGLGYSNRSYDPRLIDELTGDVIVNLLQERIELDILSLSAGYVYTFKETDNWSFDFGIGASANIVVHSDYGIEPVSVLRNGDIVKGRATPPPSKPLHDGVNEGGSLKENIYMTTDLSFGLLRRMNEKTFFTIRPEYRVHSFTDGIGPNNDLINNVSLNLGIKYNL